ncbi:MAG: D-alanine--D-alanine ligase [Candidatus Moraniibacteriota bacterium]
MKTKIALLLGGTSKEREVSLNTGNQIYRALDKTKYEVYRYDPQTDLNKFFQDALDKKFDLVFPALHGPYGEDGRMQGILDLTGAPYLFSGCLASALAMDKYKSKIVARDAGLEIIEGIKISKDNVSDVKKFTEKNGFPVVVKPDQLGSSVGISIVKNSAEMQKGLELAFSCCEEVLLEKYIKGRELTVTVMGNKNPKVLPVIEIIPKNAEWFDYKSKYVAGASDEVCPAEIPEKIRKEVQNKALKAFKAIGCKDLARADFIWSEKENKIYFLEINTIPGMTATSLVPKSAKAFGMNFENFIDSLIEDRMKK